MSIPNFNLFNKVCFDEADKTLSHVSNYRSLNNTVYHQIYFTSTIMSVSLYYIFNIRSITKIEEKLKEVLMHFHSLLL